MKKLDRIGDWIRYHAQMLLHINQYTRPQYESEDAREDQVGARTSADWGPEVPIQKVNEKGRG